MLDIISYSAMDMTVKIGGVANYTIARSESRITPTIITNFKSTINSGVHMTVCTQSLMDKGIADDIARMTGYTSRGRGNTPVILKLMASLKIGSVGRMTSATINRCANIMTTSITITVNTGNQSAIICGGMTFQTIADRVITVNIYQSIASMAASATNNINNRNYIVVGNLMTSRKISLVGSMTGGTGAAIL